MTAASSDFLGAGWAFPVQVDARGRIALSRREHDVEEAMLMILLTPRISSRGSLRAINPHSRPE